MPPPAITPLPVHRDLYNSRLHAPSLVTLINQYVVPDFTTLHKVLECPESEQAPTEIRAEYLRKKDKGEKHLLRIRRSKMNKHRRTKFRKRFQAYLKTVRLRREVKKEKLFRAELLAQIKEAEGFDAEKHVKNILHVIKHKPRPETWEETAERVYNLKLQHRTNVDLVTPKFDDPVPPFRKKKFGRHGR